jgi:outer membrane protein assembly factor BamB
MKMKSNAKFISMIVLLTVTGSFAADWPQWQGINRDGKSVETGLLKTWSSGTPRLVWRTGNLGEGFSGPSVVGNRLYIMGGMSETNALMAIDIENGNILWTTKFGVAGLVGNAGSGNTFPGPRGTPTVDGDMIYGIDHHGEFICVNAADGKILWSKDFVKDFGGNNPRWAYAESPLVDGNQVVVTPGGPQGAIVAFNKRTGEVIWKSKNFTDDAQYSSIVIAQIDGVRQYVQLTMQNVVGISPKDGSVLWKAPREGRTAVIPTPIVDGNYVYVTSGYSVGSHLFHITSSNGRFSAEQVYAERGMDNQHGGVVKLGDYFYGYSDSRGLACQKFLTGEIVWAERAKISKGAVTYADGMLYFREEKSGDMVLVDAVTTGYSEKGRFKQPDRAEDMAWPHPVIANGKLYFRDQDNLFCYDVRGE